MNRPHDLFNFGFLLLFGVGGTGFSLMHWYPLIGTTLAVIGSISGTIQIGLGHLGVFLAQELHAKNKPQATKPPPTTDEKAPATESE